MICPSCAGEGFEIDGDGWTEYICVDCSGNGNPTVDVVVVNYRTPYDLEGFLASTEVIRDDTKWTLTIIDVDPEDPAAAVAIAPDRSLLIQTPTNIGYGRACNLAATKCQGDVLAFFNADIVLREGAIEHCVETLLSDSKAAVVGPRQVDTHNRLVSAGIVGGPKGHAHPRSWKQRDRGQHTDVEELVSVSGSAYLVRRRVWDEMAACPIYQAADPGSEGAFLQTQHYYEETWFSYHVRAHGYKVLYDGKVTITHLWHRASPEKGRIDGEVMKESRKVMNRVCAAHRIPHK